MEKKSIIGNTSQIAANYLKKRVIKETTRKRMVSLHLCKKNVLLAEFSSKEFPVQTSDMLH